MINPNWIKQALFFGILLGIPLLAFLGVQAYQQWDNSLPVINPDGTEEKPHTIPEFSFTNQAGKTVTLDDLKGKIFVANFFFTSCPSTCPPMMEQLTRVQDQFRDNPEFRIISHTVDPKRDTVEALREYGKKYGVQKGFWHLVTGSKKSLYLMARNGYGVASLEGGNSPAGFVHSSKVMLVDRKQRIRGFYDGTKKEAVDRLINDIEYLLKQSK